MPSTHRDREVELRGRLLTHKEALQKETQTMLFRTLPKAVLAGGAMMMTYFTVRWLVSRKKDDQKALSQEVSTPQRDSQSGIKGVLKKIGSVVAMQMALIALGLARKSLLKYLQRSPANKTSGQVQAPQ